jgi:hypothetical protein
MLISSKARQDFENDRFENTRPKLVQPLTDIKTAVDKSQWSAPQRDDRIIDCPQENGFFKGLLVVLPFSILFWILAIWGITFVLP